MVRRKVYYCKTIWKFQTELDFFSLANLFYCTLFFFFWSWITTKRDFSQRHRKGWSRGWRWLWWSWGWFCWSACRSETQRRRRRTPRRKRIRRSMRRLQWIRFNSTVLRGISAREWARTCTLMHCTARETILVPTVAVLTDIAAITSALATPDGLAPTVPSLTSPQTLDRPTPHPSGDNSGNTTTLAFPKDSELFPFKLIKRALEVGLSLKEKSLHVVNVSPKVIAISTSNWTISRPRCPSTPRTTAWTKTWLFRSLVQRLEFGMRVSTVSNPATLASKSTPTWVRLKKQKRILLKITSLLTFRLLR